MTAELDPSTNHLHLPPDMDTLRVLLATDNHLGCWDRDPVRSDDAMRTFEEILTIAKSVHADFLLLGGDLFHHNKPSRKCLFETIQLLRKYCLGDRPVGFEVLSDPNTVFHSRSCCNYEDPNINISLPVFAIHGNHDDPSGAGGHAALDILDSANLLNYFGRVEDISEFCVNPVLLRKGRTRLALYGIGAIRDERLHRSLVNKKVSWSRPNQDQEQWFNMLVLHQNRTRHSAVYKNSIPESLLPNFLDLVVWAHEHECKIELEPSSEGQFYVTQPGSSACTSLCTAETVKKHVGVLEIRRGDDGDAIRMTPVPLQSPRPFILEDVVLEDYARELSNPKDTDAVAKFLHKRVLSCITKAEIEFPLPAGVQLGSKDWLPVIRLRVDCRGYEIPSIRRFGQDYVGKVANPDDIIQIIRRKSAAGPKIPAAERDITRNLVVEVDAEGREIGVCIEDLVKDNLTRHEKRLSVLAEIDLVEALEKFVDKGETHSIEDSINKRLTNLQSILKSNNLLTPENIGDLIIDNTDVYRRQLQADDDRAVRNLEEDRHRIDAMLGHAGQEEIPAIDIGDRSDDDVVEVIPTPSRTTASTKRKASDILGSLLQQETQRPRTTANRSRARSRV